MFTDDLLWKGVRLLSTANFQTATESKVFFSNPYSHPDVPGVTIKYDKNTDNLLARSEDSPDLAIPVCYFKGTAVICIFFYNQHKLDNTIRCLTFPSLYYRMQERSSLLLRCLFGTQGTRLSTKR